MRIPALDAGVLQALCDVLADTGAGLTGSEIGQLLAHLAIEDSEISTKRHRLNDALGRRQARDGCGNLVAAFVQAAMEPVRYAGRSEVFSARRDRLNEILSFAGMSLGEDGKLRAVDPAKTLDEAQQRAGRLRAELARRNVHPDVLRFCRAELLQENFFHAVFEATKSVADKIRQQAGLTSDGADLVDQAFGRGGGVPRLAFNSLQTETERSEHTGLMNLLKGMFGTFRNVTAHAPKITWKITEQDALDLLTLASLLHRRLDSAVFTGVVSQGGGAAVGPGAHP
jgi:uncharacterized protein (TIGR02391 family)